MGNFLLFGFKNCGKTYWGKRIAEEMSYSFKDTDHILEALYAQEYKKEKRCAEIYRTLGNKAFRQLEQNVLFTLNGSVESLVALGGGTVLCPRNLSFLQQLGTLIYLKVAKMTLKKRLFSGEPPAFLDARDLERSFEQHYLERCTLYETIHAHQIDLDGKSDEEIGNRFKEIMRDGK